MAIAVVLRFYKGAVTWSDIWDMTLRQFSGLVDEMNVLITLENKQEQGLSGKAATGYLEKLAAKNARLKKESNGNSR